MLPRNEWKKPHGSTDTNCVEVFWKTSSKSPSGDNSCVEVAIDEVCGKIYVRNSNDRNGPVVTYTEGEWKAFVAGAKDGEFDLV